MSALKGEDVVEDCLYQDIIANARKTAASFEAQLQSVALAKVPEKVAEANRCVETEFEERKRYLYHLATKRTKPEDEQLCKLEDVLTDTLRRTTILPELEDHALSSLDGIVLQNERECSLAYMKRVDTGPVYDTWFPVLQNFFVSKPDMDPFRPYFGEHKKGVRQASEVYKQMLNDTAGPKRFLYESDGDFDDDGTMTSFEEDSFNELSQLRKRAGIRKAIHSAASQVGKTDAVWAALSIAFGMDERRIRLYNFIAETREAHTNEREKRRSQASKFANDIREVLMESPDHSPSNENLSRGASEYFCFNCHIFACNRHKGENVEPFRPIPDHATMKRLINLQRKRATSCSLKCFLLPEWEQDQNRDGEGHPWTPEELTLMREGGAIYEVDPCSLSVVVGSKSCREVYTQLQFPGQKEIVRANYELHITPRVHFSERGVGTVSRRGRDRTSRSGRGRPRSRPSQGLKSTCSITKEQEKNTGEHETFIPCNHPGPCTGSNGCICAQRKLRCESTCGCNFGRYGSGKNGMRWDPPTEAEIKDGVSVRCKNRHLGCKCKQGNCNSENCECYISQRLCNPDHCNHCESAFLPHETPIHQRRCRNVDLITGRHKKTISGKSGVHGFGLFAAEHFCKGELVGHYSGRTIDPEHVDKMLRSSEARRRTYAFNLTDKYVIDGLCLGGKVRYINHSAEEANCEARFERVRGEGRIAIRTTKYVKAGQEFLFDYKITSGNGWLEGASDDSESDNETWQSSPAVAKDEPITVNVKRSP